MRLGAQSLPQEGTLRDRKGTWMMQSLTDDVDGCEFQFEWLKRTEKIWHHHQDMWFSEQRIRRLLSSDEEVTNATNILQI